MTILHLIFALLWAFFAVAAYRLGVADGISAARRGRLAGGRSEERDEILKRIEAYNGRKERHEQHQ